MRTKSRDGETTIKIKCSLFRGGGEALGAERRTVQNAAFHGKRHDNKILKVRILLSRNFVVIAQAPRNGLFPDLLFLAFLEKARKTTQKSKDFSLLRTPKIPGKEGENAQKSKEIPRDEKSKEIQKSKERKIRVIYDCKINYCHLNC